MKQISKFFLAVLMMVVSTTIALASSGPGDPVTGIVKDAKGAPVVGAVVTDDAQKAFSTTDENGAFAIVPTTSNIVVTSLGFKTKTVYVKPGQVVNVVLEDDTTLLDDAVVVGYAVQSRANLTGAVATVDVENPNALGVVETFSGASAIVAADAAAKTADVTLVELRIARGMCGKSYLIMTGEVAAVQAAVDNAKVAAGDKGMLLDYSVTPNPDPKLWEKIL